VLASAWFTDQTIAQAIVDSRATIKLALFNKSDIERCERVAYRRVMEAPDVHVCVLGTDSFEDGVMHHKFCVIDHALVWTGSFNFTLHARRNYETLLRIDEPAMNEQYWQEAVQLIYADPIAMVDGMSVAVPDDVIICRQCRRELDAEDAHWAYDAGPLCPTCTRDFYERY
jgi:phosphatidylserine/phosphatidylglycerophosphate/cardiolipin synthase-like enzyme